MGFVEATFRQTVDLLQENVQCLVIFTSRHNEESSLLVAPVKQAALLLLIMPQKRTEFVCLSSLPNSMLSPAPACAYTDISCSATTLIYVPMESQPVEHGQKRKKSSSSTGCVASAGKDTLWHATHDHQRNCTNLQASSCMPTDRQGSSLFVKERESLPGGAPPCCGIRL